MDKQTFKITTVIADGFIINFTIRAYNLKDATKFAVDRFGTGYQSITVEVIS
jgi:hypothetical protein